jgi:hypothetical protein
MTVLSVVQSACLVLGLDQPDVLMTNTDREYQELARLANDTARMIAEDYDWQTLQKINTYTGNGTDEAFDLPDDYDRMADGANIWSSRWLWGLNKITTTDLWLEMLTVPYTFIYGNWIMFGGQLHLLPVMPATETVKFFYVSDLIVKAANATLKTAFTADDDTFRLPERLLELGIIWRSKKDKGLPFDAEKAEYDDLFAKKAKKDGGAQAIVRGSAGRVGRGVKLAFPLTVGG